MNHSFRRLLSIIGQVGCASTRWFTLVLGVLFIAHPVGQFTIHAGNLFPIWVPSGVVPADLDQVKAVVVFGVQSIALRQDGTLVAWGDGPKIPEAARTGISAIASGDGFVLALKNGGQVIEWNLSGTLMSTTPIEAQENGVQVAASGEARVVLKTDGSVIAWGGTPTTTPVVPPEASSRVVNICAGSFHLGALKDDGSVILWNPGQNHNALLPVPKSVSRRVVRLESSWVYVSAVMDDGTAATWRAGESAAMTMPEGFNRGLRQVSPSYPAFASVSTNGLLTVIDSQGIPVNLDPSIRGAVQQVSLGGNYLYAMVVPTPPSVVKLPVGNTMVEHQRVTLSADAYGLPLALQWFKDGKAIPGATNRDLVIPRLELGDAGGYQIQASNPMGTVMSDPAAVLSVRPTALQPGRVVLMGFPSLGDNSVPASLESGVVQVAASELFKTALMESGEVVTWGVTPGAQPEEASREVAAIAAGAGHVLALKNQGKVISWGDNAFGPYVVPDEALHDVQAVAAGSFHSLALTFDGRVVAWGATNDARSSVPARATAGVRAIAAGGGHSLAVLESGEVIAWGLNDAGQCDVPAAARSGVLKVAAGIRHSLALKADGSVVAWGDNGYNQSTVPAAAREGVVSIAAGSHHSCAATASGRWIGWGDSYSGQLDLADEFRGGVSSVAAVNNQSMALLTRHPPRIWEQPVGAVVRPASAISLLVRASGHPLVYEWRRNGSPIPGATNAVLNLPGDPAADSGDYTVYVSNNLGGELSDPPAHVEVSRSAPVKTGSVFAWGIGAGATVPDEAKAGVHRLVVGLDHALALRAEGRVVAWGDNTFGQTNVPPEALTNIIAVAAGASHSLALSQDGRVIAWGAGATNSGLLIHFGQSLVPQEALSGVVAIGAGTYHSLALKQDGSVVAWGLNDGNQSASRGVPQVRYAGLTGGYKNSMALRVDGRVDVWGSTNDPSYLIPAFPGGGLRQLVGNSYSFAGATVTGGVIQWPIGPRVSLGINRTNLQKGVQAVSIAEGRSVYLLAGGEAFEPTATPIEVRRGALAVGAAKSFTAVLVEPIVPEIVLVTGATNAFTQQTVQLEATVFGYPVSLQWYHDGTPIPGATNRDLILGNVRTDDRGLYSIGAGNFLGATTRALDTELTVLPSEGRVALFGLNTDGQTNLPSLASSRVVALAGGSEFFLALDDTGHVFGWGGNFGGPLTIPDAAKEGVVSIDAWYSRGAALRRDGTPVLWGSDGQYGVLDIPEAAKSDVVQISLKLHCLALKKDRTAVGWGSSVEGELPIPDSIQGRILQIQAGGGFSVARLSDGQVVAWGTSRNDVTNVPPLARTNVVQIAVGYAHVLALRADGQLVTWGASPSGLLQIPPEANGNVRQIFAGWRGSGVVKTDGTAVTWLDPDVPAMRTPLGIREVSTICFGNSAVGLIIGAKPTIQLIRDEASLNLLWPSQLSAMELEEGVWDGGPSPAWSPVSPSVQEIGSFLRRSLDTKQEGRFYRLHSN